MKNNKLVSIIVLTYNSAETVKETILSIISQTYKNIEIIVSDNDSQDNTLKIIRSIKDKRIKISKNKTNIGYSGNINKAIGLCKGEYIAVFHSDDVYYKDIVEKEVKVLDKNKEIIGVFALCDVIGSKGNKISRKEVPFETKESLIIGDKNRFFSLMLKHGNFFVCSSAMLRRETYQKIGLWTLKYTKIEDQDMWLRILSKYKLAIINEHLMKYRIYDYGSKHYKKYRTEISPEYMLYDKYIKEGFTEIDKETMLSYKKMKSKGYLFCAVNSLIIKDIKMKEYNLRESLNQHTFKFTSIWGIIQRILSLKIDIILRTFVIILIKLLKIFKLNKRIYFLNFI